MKIALTVCDTCKDRERPAQQYEVRSEGRRATVDLCEEHAESLEEILAQAGPAKPVKKRGARRAPVTSIEDIEKRKAATS